MTAPRKIAEIAADIDKANKDHDEVSLRYQEASRAHSEARTKVNALQKEMDEAVAALRKASPRDSDWGNARVQKFAV